MVTRKMLTELKDNRKKLSKPQQEPIPEEKVLSRDEILAEVAPLQTRAVRPAGWSGAVKMQNITFQKLVDLKTSCPDNESYHAMLISEVCVDLSLEDAIKLQRGNGIRFAALYAAVEEFGATPIKDETLKN
jgi:hypothetical protein